MWAVLPVAAMPLLHSTAERDAKGVIATMHRQHLNYTQKGLTSQEKTPESVSIIPFLSGHLSIEHPIEGPADVYERRHPGGRREWRLLCQGL